MLVSPVSEGTVVLVATSDNVKEAYRAVIVQTNCKYSSVSWHFPKEAGAAATTSRDGILSSSSSYSRYL
jgi:hypothetical protein